MNIQTRLSKPTPKLIKKVQKIAAMIGGSGTMITSSVSMFSEFNMPVWIPFVILFCTILNNFILELTTTEDFK